MDIKELTELLVTSSENDNQTKFIPWWIEDYEKDTYRYGVLKEEIVRDAESCAAECSGEELLSPVGRLGLTLFHLLVLHNFYDAVEKILSDKRVQGADVDLPDHKGGGLTPFLLACSRGNLAMARLLLEHGADDSSIDQRGMNAYHFLVYHRAGDLACDTSCLERSALQRAEIARLLTCDINQKNAAGLTPLEQMLSIENNSKYTWPLTEVFLKKGARTDYVDKEGNTLLMMAMEHDHITASFQLIKHCPEMLDAENSDGVTPIRHASDYCEHALSFALTEYGAAPGKNHDITYLSETARHAFSRLSGDERDGLDLALYIAEKLMRQVDTDEDEEMEEAADVMHQALRADGDAHILDICKDAGFSFTQPLHHGSKVFCLRDECLNASLKINTLKKLIELGVDMDNAVADGRTPANILASDDGRPDRGREAFYQEAARLFSRESMEQTNDRGESAIHLAVKNGHMAMLEVMLEKGVDCNLTTDVPAEAGLTPLHLACINGHVDMAKLLIAAGADDTIKNLKGETPAHLVLQKRRSDPLAQEQKAELLKELKHLDIPGENGRTPLMLLTHTDIELLPIFLERGVDVNHADEYGRTPLMLSPNKDIMKELLRAGADLHRADKDGNTALHHMLLHGAEAEARYLIRKGADYNRPNNEGETPAQIAAEHGLETVLDIMTDIR